MSLAPVLKVNQGQFHNQIMSLVEFAALPDDGYRYEYIGGRTIMMSPAGVLHGAIASQITYLLSHHLYPQRAGIILDSSTGFRLPNGDVRSPDISVILSDRLVHEGLVIGFGETPPDLTVEIISSNERYEDVVAKVQLYLDWSVNTVWVVEPAQRMVVVYRREGVVRLTAEDELNGGEAVPGFVCKVSELFPR